MLRPKTRNAILSVILLTIGTFLILHLTDSAKIKKQEKEIAEKTSQLSELQSSYQKAKAKNQSISAELSQTNQALSVIRKKFSESDVKLKNLTLKRDSLNTELNATKSIVRNYENQIRNLEVSLTTESQKRREAETERDSVRREFTILSDRYKATEITLKTQTQKAETLEELKYRLAPRCAVLVSGIFEPNADSLHRKIRPYLKPLSIRETEWVYSDKASKMRDVARRLKVEPESFYSFSKSLNINPLSMCLEQSREAFRQLLAGDLRKWSMDLYECDSATVDRAISTIKTINRM